MGDSKCRNCGASIGRFRVKCPKCGQSRLRKLGKQYTGVRMQQGRVAIDNDWDEATHISRRTSEKIATINCESCGALNSRKNTRCRNCSANL